MNLANSATALATSTNAEYGHKIGHGDKPVESAQSLPHALGSDEGEIIGINTREETQDKKHKGQQTAQNQIGNESDHQ